jgi:energy-coupling factor transporter ATP-binding protein EcfA2
MPAAKKYAEPFSWWGPAWADADWRTIADLLRDGTIDTDAAALIWAALARRRSLAVIAGPSGAGKTTLLGALLDLLPVDTRRIYIRGCFETFAFLSDVDVAPERAALLVNEISPHLPVYLWGPAVARLLDAADDGFTLLATAHAESVPAFVGLLTGPPLRIDAAKAGAFELVVLLDRVPDNASGRRVRGVWRLSRAPSAIGVERLWPDGNDVHLASFVPADELTMRSRLLRRLQTGDIGDASELHAYADTASPPDTVERASSGRVASAQAQPPVRKRDSTPDLAKPR